MSRLVDQSLGKPIQGVSQQAESLRAKGQCNEQINFIPDPVVGLRRRPHTQYILEMAEYSIYVDYSDAEGDKMLCVGGGIVDIFNPSDSTLTSVTIVDTDAYDYIIAGILSSVRRSAAFVEDSLYISNPTVAVAEDATYVPPTRYDEIGIVYCLGGQYSREYRIDIKYDDGTTQASSFTTPDGTATAHYPQIQSTYIINQLATGGIGSDTNLDVTVHLDHIAITSAPAATKVIESITCSDDEGGLALKCAYPSVKTVDELPEFAPVGAVITVAGQAGSDDDAYFEFATPNSPDTGLSTMGTAGIWVETVKSGDEFQFDYTTMPVVITQSGATYSLDLAEWKGREIGDANSNETPSITDKTIKDMTNIQGRLGLLSKDSVLFSRTKRPTELWRRSIIGGVLTDDAIDGSSDSSTGTNTYFTKVAQDLAVFSKQGQYVILGSQALTPDNVNLTLTTRNTSADTVSPIGVAGNLYYATDNGDYTGVSEYYKEDIQFFSLPVASQIPRYIIGESTHFKGSKPQHLLALKTDYDDTLLYCYKFLFSGKKRIQSAWFKLQFNNDIKHYFFTSNSMIIVTATTGGHVIERLDFEAIVTSGLEFEVHLDRSKTYTLDANNEITPLDIHKEADVIFVSLDSTAAGLPVEYEVNGANYKMLSGVTGNKVVAGYKYSSEYTPTAPRVFDRANEVIQTGELNVNNLLVNVATSGVFSWRVDTNYNTYTEGEFSHRVWGAIGNEIGGEPLHTEQRRIPWRGKATEKTCTISCDKHTPLNISYIEFTGDLRKTKTRI